MVRRVYLEKKESFDMEARRLKDEIAGFLGEKHAELTELRGLRILKRYDAEHLNEEQFKQVTEAVFSEAQCDKIFYGVDFPAKKDDCFFAVEYMPGQYDQRADSAEQCAELVTGKKPRIKTATVYILESPKPLSVAALEGVKKYLINPVEAREASPALPSSLEENENIPPDVPVLTDFSRADTTAFAAQYGLAMSQEDLLFCRDYFARTFFFAVTTLPVRTGILRWLNSGCWTPTGRITAGIPPSTPFWKK